MDAAPYDLLGVAQHLLGYVKRMPNDLFIRSSQRANTRRLWYVSYAPKFLHPLIISQTMSAESVDFGIMFDQTTMMSMRTVLPMKGTAINFCMNLFHKEISAEFPMHIVDPRAISPHSHIQRGRYDRIELFRFRIPLSQLKVIHQTAGQGHQLILLISSETPPRFFKQLDPSMSHDEEAVAWGDNDAWYRQTDLVYVPNGLKKSALTWKKTNPIIDLGKH